MEKNEVYDRYEVELSLLRSDLSGLFSIYGYEGAVYQPDDMSAPAEFVLAGSYNFGEAPFEISLSQRIDQNGINYLLICAVERYDHYWCFVNGKEALTVSGGRPPMTLEEIVSVRAMISEDHATWSRAHSESIVTTRISSPYDWMEKICGKPAD